MKTQHFDVIVIGGGPAGAVSALKCSELGLNVLLIEQKTENRHKPCGGILTPACVDTIHENLDAILPHNVACSPEKLGLYYIPPSGGEKGGSMSNYKLFNINRDLFDNWLINLAEDSGVQVWYGTEFLELRQSKLIQVLARKKGSIVKMTSQYLIGADGVHSKLRRQLYPKIKVETLPVLQEHWRAEGDFDNYFYAFFSGEISSTYAYVMPKDGLYVVGVGAPKKHSTSVSMSIGQFKEWLSKEFAFKPLRLVRRETWAIPYGFDLEGVGNVILVGDAAGFCNTLSGEGIRFAIESGVAVGNAIQEALSSNRHLAPIYMSHAEWIYSFLRMTHEFAIHLTDEGREEFVRSELSRISWTT
ncbi:MAG: NAD(P)/FAD-dependent oxidoreductase [Candidatus Bathyarchaeia archaeon]